MAAELLKARCEKYFCVKEENQVGLAAVIAQYVSMAMSFPVHYNAMLTLEMLFEWWKKSK